MDHGDDTEDGPRCVTLRLRSEGPRLERHLLAAAFRLLGLEPPACCQRGGGGGGGGGGGRSRADAPPDIAPDLVIMYTALEGRPVDPVRYGPPPPATGDAGERKDDSGADPHEWRETEMVDGSEIPRRATGDGGSSCAGRADRVRVFRDGWVFMVYAFSETPLRLVHALDRDDLSWESRARSAWPELRVAPGVRLFRDPPSFYSRLALGHPTAAHDTAACLAAAPAACSYAGCSPLDVVRLSLDPERGRTTAARRLLWPRPAPPGAAVERLIRASCGASVSEPPKLPLSPSIPSPSPFRSSFPSPSSLSPACVSPERTYRPEECGNGANDHGSVATLRVPATPSRTKRKAPCGGPCVTFVPPTARVRVAGPGTGPSH